jgi:hypothetical protein
MAIWIFRKVGTKPSKGFKNRLNELSDGPGVSGPTTTAPQFTAYNVKADEKVYEYPAATEGYYPNGTEAYYADTAYTSEAAYANDAAYYARQGHGTEAGYGYGYDPNTYAEYDGQYADQQYADGYYDREHEGQESYVSYNAPKAPSH